MFYTFQNKISPGLFMKWKWIIGLILIGLLGLIYYFSLPSPLFDAPYSTVLEDRQGHLLSASIASDGQWRFPQADSIPEKFRDCITLFEDEYFYHHPGFNPVSLLRAMWQNWQANSVVSGGSTLTMQVIRLARDRQPRTVLEKLIEITFATRLELADTKEEILRLYASHAPFGGNVVGLEAAAWRYYGLSPSQLSWGETATLAVLPNSPALIYPGKNQEQLEQKRNRLLDKLYERKVIDSLTCVLAKAESLPGNPLPLPAEAPHLLTRIRNEGMTGSRVRSTLDEHLQQQVTNIVQRHYQQLKGNGIYNAAALVLDVKTGEVKAYVGNTRIAGKKTHGASVDIITAPRSTGSILKPFLYAAMLTEGSLLPYALVPDVPTFIRGFAPKNFDEGYDGAVPADEVISRSLNVPAVLMLRKYGVEKFHYQLKKTGMTTLDQPPGHYGLSLILGGAEANLWDLTGMYAGLARTMNDYFLLPEPERYNPKDFSSPVYIKHHERLEKQTLASHGVFSAGALWYTFEAMAKVRRPGNETGWEYYDSSEKIAWKTGTSQGFRDAWAIGITPEYAIGVWVGNADGEGRPGLTGLTAAAPVLFDIVKLMPEAKWFDYPASDMAAALISKESGFRASPVCQDTITMDVPRAETTSPLCPYHQLIHLDASGQYRVSSDCVPVSEMEHISWLVLPAVQEWYYRQKNPAYRKLPPYLPGCGDLADHLPLMQVIYPRQHAQVYIPKELNGKEGKVVVEVAHRYPETRIFWHLDGQYIGETKYQHQMGLQPGKGKHQLTLIDEHGEVLEQTFEVL